MWEVHPWKRSHKKLVTGYTFLNLLFVLIFPINKKKIVTASDSHCCFHISFAPMESNLDEAGQGVSLYAQACQPGRLVKRQPR